MRPRIPPPMLAVGLLLAATCATAQVASRGTDFWTCDLENDVPGNTGRFGLVVVNPGATDAFVQVEGASGLLDSATVAPGTHATFSLDRSRMMTGTSRALNACHVIATEPVTVFQFNPAALAAVSTDATVLLPTPSLGTAYRPMSRPQQVPGDMPGLVGIVGLSVEPTTVTFTPRGDVRAGFVPATPAGTPITFTLERFEVAQFMTSGTVPADFTGSLVTSDRPVAVLGGNRCAQVPNGVPACDHLEEVAYPITAWGRDFLAVKSPPRGPEPDYYSVVASEDGTSVVLTPDPGGSPFTLQAGEHVEFTSTGDVHVAATKPVQVGQYLVGQQFHVSMTTGDPSLILIVPTEQLDTDHVVYSSEYFPTHHIVIVKPDAATASLDGVPVPAASFTPIGSTGYSRARIEVLEGLHRVNASAGVGVYAYGYVQFGSYGYHAGARAVAINAPIKCESGGALVAGCDGSITLDGSASSGPGPLAYLWSSLTPGVTIATPDAPVTLATVTGTGPWMVSLTVSNGVTATSCLTTITGSVTTPPPPAELSGAVPWLRVAKTPGDPTTLDVTLELPAGPGEVANLYAGTILPVRFVAYDHAPAVCHDAPAIVGPGMGLLRVPFDAGTSHYYLVSASNCGDEGSRGSRSDGVARPDLPTDCGAFP